MPSWEIDVPVYPPSTFLVLTPLTLLRYPLARLLWFLLNGCLFIFSAVLVLSACPQSHRWLATTLGSLILATSGILLIVGQPAALAISLVIISSYLFLRTRYLPLGAFLLMLSLAVKPQIGGLIALYFLAQKMYRRYAAVALVGALALLLFAGLFLKVRPQSANWASTLRTNLAATLSPGGSADPRPANQVAVGDINLQTLTSIFFAEAGTFNLVAYAVFLGLVAVWILMVARSNMSPEMQFLALAALSILSLMPVYHRAMAIVSLTLELLIEQAHSLKDRRQVVRSLKEKLRHGFNISVAELDEAVTWQSATIGVTAISRSRDYLSGLMRQVENAAVRIANDLGAQVADSWCTFLEEDAEE